MYSHVSNLDAVELAAAAAEFVDKCPCIVFVNICGLLSNFFCEVKVCVFIVRFLCDATL